MKTTGARVTWPRAVLGESPASSLSVNLQAWRISYTLTRWFKPSGAGGQASASLQRQFQNRLGKGSFCIFLKLRGHVIELPLCVSNIDTFAI